MREGGAGGVLHEERTTKKNSSRSRKRSGRVAAAANPCYLCLLFTFSESDFSVFFLLCMLYDLFTFFDGLKVEKLLSSLLTGTEKGRSVVMASAR